MKRPVMVTIATVVQEALGLGSTALVFTLLALTRSQEVLKVTDPAAEKRGLMLGAMVLVLPSVAYFVAARGMRKRRRWGWLAALSINITGTLVFVYNMFDEGIRKVDGDELPFVVGFTSIVVLLLLPSVRKFYWEIKI